jgi:hypothetical protein
MPKRKRYCRPNFALGHKRVAAAAAAVGHLRNPKIDPAVRVGMLGSVAARIDRNSAQELPTQDNPSPVSFLRHPAFDLLPARQCPSISSPLLEQAAAQIDIESNVSPDTCPVDHYGSPFAVHYRTDNQLVAAAEHPLPAKMLP